MELTIGLLQLYSLRATDEPTMLSSFKTLICSIKLTSKESNTGRKNEFALICSRQIYAANLWQLRSKSRANMVNATFASLSYLQPLFFGIQTWHLPPLPNIFLFGDIFARSKFVQNHFLSHEWTTHRSAKSTALPGYLPYHYQLGVSYFLLQEEIFFAHSSSSVLQLFLGVLDGYNQKNYYSKMENDMKN